MTIEHNGIVFSIAAASGSLINPTTTTCYQREHGTITLHCTDLPAGVTIVDLRRALDELARDNVGGNVPHVAGHSAMMSAWSVTPHVDASGASYWICTAQYETWVRG